MEHHKKAKNNMPKYASRINLLITNVSSKHLPHNEVYELYSYGGKLKLY
ncbi:hypothetical protein [Bacillus paranthracis]|nr:hypothetical protein [Bacillus paranthracis]